jgi:hypothetical protein
MRRDTTYYRRGGTTHLAGRGRKGAVRGTTAEHQMDAVRPALQFPADATVSRGGELHTPSRRDDDEGGPSIVGAVIATLVLGLLMIGLLATLAALFHWTI